MFVVSRAGKAYDARVRGPNRKFRLIVQDAVNCFQRADSLMIPMGIETQTPFPDPLLGGSRTSGQGDESFLQIAVHTNYAV